MMNRKRILLCLLAIAFLLAPLAACGAPTVEEPTSEPEPVKEEAPPEPTPIPFLQPGEVPEPELTLEDTDSSLRAYENRALSGDIFLDGLYERPFTSREMVYQPDLNILTVSIAADEDFFYFTIALDGYNEAIDNVTGAYGIEFDRTKTGRGDLLLWAHGMQEEWSSENVIVFEDTLGVVGGVKPIFAETGFEGKGYTTPVEMHAERVAHVRLVKEEKPRVQFAISRALLGDPEEFLWSGWADGGLKEPGMFDYNDRFSRKEAGSPLRDSEFYPVKELFSLDNTCRLAYGFDQIEGIPGACKGGLECTKVCVGGTGPSCRGGTWVTVCK